MFGGKFSWHFRLCVDQTWWGASNGDDDLLATLAGVVSLSERLESIELTEKVRELQTMCIQHVQEKAELWGEIQRLRHHLEVRVEMRLVHGAFWRGEVRSCLGG